MPLAQRGSIDPVEARFLGHSVHFAVVTTTQGRGFRQTWQNHVKRTQLSGH